MKNSTAGTGPAQAQAQSSFLNIPSLFQHVQNNLMCAGRHSYFIRVILVISFRNSATVPGQEKVRDVIAENIAIINKEVSADKLTGLILVYETHSIQMLEGSEDCVGKFAKRLDQLAEEYFKLARLVLVNNNVNQVNGTLCGLSVHQIRI